MQEQEEHAALVAELRATLTNLTSRGLLREEDHESAVAAMTAEHESTVSALGQSLEAERDTNTVLAAEVARLEENSAGEEASVRRLEGALEETTQRHGEEAAAMTALVEEHAAQQRRCRARIQEEHRALAASPHRRSNGKEGEVRE
jgi:hypothetical protein